LASPGFRFLGRDDHGGSQSTPKELGLGRERASRDVGKQPEPERRKRCAGTSRTRRAPGLNDGRPLFTLAGYIQEPQVLCPGVHEQGAQRCRTSPTCWGILGSPRQRSTPGARPALAQSLPEGVFRPARHGTNFSRVFQTQIGCTHEEYVTFHRTHERGEPTNFFQFAVNV